VQDSQAEWLHLRNPIKTYKHKKHEHNNTSWEQRTRNIRSVDFNEDLNLWKQDVQEDYSVASQHVLRKILIVMNNYWTADTTGKNDHVCFLHDFDISHTTADW